MIGTRKETAHIRMYYSVFRVAFERGVKCIGENSCAATISPALLLSKIFAKTLNEFFKYVVSERLRTVQRQNWLRQHLKLLSLILLSPPTVPSSLRKYITGEVIRART